MALQNTFMKAETVAAALIGKAAGDESRHRRGVLQHRPGAARGSDRDAKKGGKMIQNDFTIHIRRAESGDEACLAHVQTESWKAAFAGIVPAELLAQCTSIERAEKMYARLLAEQQGNGYILELDGKPHCVAWWDAAREEDMPGAAELRCIHSLPENWRRGCGSRMMERVLADVKAAGYTKLLLWVFTDNVRAIRFYEAQGFTFGGRKQPAFGTTEEIYVRAL